MSGLSVPRSGSPITTDRSGQGPGHDTGSPSSGQTSPLKRRKPGAGCAEPLHVGFHPTVRTADVCFVPRPFGELALAGRPYLFV